MNVTRAATMVTTQAKIIARYVEGILQSIAAFEARILLPPCGGDVVDTFDLAMIWGSLSSPSTKTNAMPLCDRVPFSYYFQIWNSRGCQS